jgi:hypothetical protein
MMRRLFFDRRGDLHIFWEMAALIFTFIATCAIGVGLIMWAGNAADARSCYEKSEAYGLSADYGFFKGCIVKTENGTVTSLNNYITIREGR